MTSPYADWKRDGLTIIMKTARAICGLNQKFGFIIKSKYAGNAVIIGLMTIIDTLCEALPSAIEEFDMIASDDPLPPSDPSELPGININAPEPPPIDTGS